MTQPALVHLPGAGGDAANFRRWQSLLPGVEIRTPSRPGKAARFGEPPLQTVDEMAQDVLDQVAQWDDAPLVILGFSLGALVGYEVALRLASTPRAVGALVVAGSRAPNEAENALGVHELDDAGLRQAVGQLSADAHLAMSDDDLADLLLPGIRADLEAAAAYTREVPQVHGLDIPVLALAGDRDEIAPPQTCRAWSAFTTGPFDFVRVSGDHSFLERPQDAVARPLRKLLAALPERQDGSGAGPAPGGDPGGSGLYEEVRAAWASVLGRDDFGDEVDFFAVGGSSLLAARVVATVRKRTTVKVPLRRFLAAPTVLGLVDMITEVREEA